jgi:hypothetical protein
MYLSHQVNILLDFRLFILLVLLFFGYSIYMDAIKSMEKPSTYVLSFIILVLSQKKILVGSCVFFWSVVSLTQCGVEKTNREGPD